MKKIIDWIKNNKLYVLTFIIGIGIISIIYTLNKVSPFGNKSLLCVDFFHQYGPMLAEYYDRIHSCSSLIYSFTMGLGLPFFRNFLNYLSSPFNILMMLFPRRGLVTSYDIIIGLKAVVASVTMVYYLSKKFNNKELYIIPLGIIYAFSAYFSAYYWNIMWLDGMVMVPLITYGIEKIVNKNEWKFYSINLAIMLFANYFIGYMLCIYSVVYFIYYLIYKTKFNKKNIKKFSEWKQLFKTIVYKSFLFGFASLIGGMLTFFLLIPMAYSMTSISATGGDMPTTQYYAFKFIDYIKGHLSGVKTTVFASDTITNPNISCGILSIALLMLYVINIKIPIKNKICYLLILGFFILAFFNPQLDYILHAFHVPNDLPYRYSFLYSFVLVVICAYSLINIKKIKFPFVAAIYTLLMIALYICTTQNWADITENMLYINMILLTLYFLFYSGLYFLNMLHILFYSAFIVVAAIDVIVSINYNWNITHELKNYYSEYNDTKNLLSYIKNQDKDNFYRIESLSTMTLNDGSWYNYNGMTTFSSMAYEDMAILQNNLGMPGNDINSYQYVQSTPIYDLMFNIKYFIGNTNDFSRYHSVYSGTKTAYEFDYNVGLGFGVDEKVMEWNYTAQNPFIVQNDFVTKTTNTDEILIENPVINSEKIYDDGTYTIMKYEYKNPGDNMYFYHNEYSIDFFIIGGCLYYSNDGYTYILEQAGNILEYSALDDYNEKNIVNIHSSEDIIDVYVGYTNYYINGTTMTYIDQNNFEEFYNKVNNNKLEVTNYKEHTIEAKTNLEEDMFMYTSIPYDKGWHVYVDDKEVSTHAIADTLLGFKCKKGKHNITFKYKTPYMLEGTIFSLIALSIILLDTFYKDKIFKKKNKIKKSKK